MTALSNMPLINTTVMQVIRFVSPRQSLIIIIIHDREGVADHYWDHFAPSAPMSTYLVAFVVANFTQVAADVKNANWKFNIYARPSARQQTQCAS